MAQIDLASPYSLGQPARNRTVLQQDPFNRRRTCHRLHITSRVFGKMGPLPATPS